MRSPLAAAVLTFAFALSTAPVFAQAKADPKAAPATQAPAPKKASAPAATVSDADIAAAKSAGKVWVNLESKVYHKADSKWYGKTKKGQFMTEADAQKAGARAAKSEGASGKAEAPKKK